MPKLLLLPTTIRTLSLSLYPTVPSSQLAAAGPTLATIQPLARRPQGNGGAVPAVGGVSVAPKQKRVVRKARVIRRAPGVDPSNEQRQSNKRPREEEEDAVVASDYMQENEDDDAATRQAKRLRLLRIRLSQV